MTFYERDHDTDNDHQHIHHHHHHHRTHISRNAPYPVYHYPSAMHILHYSLHSGPVLLSPSLYRGSSLVSLMPSNPTINQRFDHLHPVSFASVLRRVAWSRSLNPKVYILACLYRFFRTLLSLVSREVNELLYLSLNLYSCITSHLRTYW